MMAADLQQPPWDEAYRASARSLAILRVLFGVALLGLLLPRFQWIAGFPDEFFNPPPDRPPCSAASRRGRSSSASTPC